ncbi:hypothetical protein GGI15_001475 [Coemansia interrupta]|uniref:Methyltransferase domain-containing protein n=1 Tax=Coemansia interrupta TaxID=1126814 RepID=A0A9W8HIE1_9FUNG|nr:hypothetical protein GGI15_001475 [Coemansia interrupta]
MDTGVTLPRGFDTLDQYAAALSQAYGRFGYLAQMHIVNFFVSDQWSKLPPEWQQYFDADAFHISSLVKMASTGTVDSDCPDSLRAYIEQMVSLQFPREKLTPTADNSDACEERSRIQKYFLDGMSPKKQAEVIELSQLVTEIATATGCRRITDVGAGQGYLTRVLAYASNSSTAQLLALDHDWKQARGAEKYQKRTLKRLRGPRARSEGYVWDDALETRIVHDVQAIDMQTALKLADISQQGVPDGAFMLCGLHACGNLSSAVLRAFAESNAAAVALVPCCYNHITEKHPSSVSKGAGECLDQIQTKQSLQDEQLPGFPLSDRFPGVLLGANSLKAACQATPRWEHEFDSTMESFKRNFFRALLHHLMVSSGGLEADAPFPVVGKITTTDLDQARQDTLDQLADNRTDNSDDIDFALYVYAALKRLDYAWRPSVAQCIACRQEMQHGLKQMAAVWALRSMIGSLIESIIVVDRAAYLSRHCGPGGLVRAFALFDPVTSPRNIVLVGQRKR